MTPYPEAKKESYRALQAGPPVSFVTIPALAHLTWCYTFDIQRGRWKWVFRRVRAFNRRNI